MVGLVEGPGILFVGRRVTGRIDGTTVGGYDGRQLGLLVG